MRFEIERRFLLASKDWKDEVPIRPCEIIRQGYLSFDPERTVRIRIANEKALLTIKGKTSACSRAEFEYAIPIAEGRWLLEHLAFKPFVSKKRHTLEFADGIWTVDEFMAENHGLVLAEIELHHQSQKIQKPAWLGREVTDDSRYTNACLSQKPYSSWPADDILQKKTHEPHKKKT